MLQQTITNFLFTSNGLFNLTVIFYFLILIYLLITLYLTYFIYSILTKKNKINYIQYISVIKDKDFIFFKESLFKLYGSISILLFVYLFKYGQLTPLLDLNNYYFRFLILIYLIKK
jgi:hypothetical protein